MRLSIAALLLLAVCQFTNAQDDRNRAKSKTPTDPPSLPNALILGDSISIAYTPQVAKTLAGKINVTRPKANCGDTRRYLNALPSWLSEENWDVIHFNVGLHDLCYRHPDSKVQGKRDKTNGTIAVALTEYEKNLDRIVTMLKATGAQLVWASTTIIPEGEAGRFVGDDKKYNEVARKIMKKHGVQINDLHAISSTFPPSLFRKPGDVHFTPEGSKKLADQVTSAIREAWETANEK